MIKRAILFLREMFRQAAGYVDLEQRARFLRSLAIAIQRGNARIYRVPRDELVRF